MEKEYTEDAKIFKALCDEKRTHYRLSASGRDRALKRLARLTTPDLDREQFCYLYRIRFLAWNGWGK